MTWLVRKAKWYRNIYQEKNLISIVNIILTYSLPATTLTNVINLKHTNLN